jgi:hypothetical protein
MLKTIFSNGKMKYNLNIGLVFKFFILVHLSFRIREHQDGNLDSRIVIEYHFYINDGKVHDNIFCNSVLGYTCNTSKTKATHSL